MLFVANIVIALLLNVSSQADSSIDRCTVRRETSVPLVLADGRTASIDAKSVVKGKDEFLILGAPATAWPQKGSTLPPTRLFGAVKSAKSLRPVVIPFKGAKFPRALFDGRTGWHVLFVQSLNTSDFQERASMDSAVIWYAHYDGNNWSNQRKLARVTDARLSSEFASNLAAVGNEFWFAFGFDHFAKTQSNSDGNQGVVMMRFPSTFAGEAIAKLDTLPTREPPTSIQIAERSERNNVSVFLSQPFFSNGRFWPTSLFEIPFRNGWLTPQVMIADSIRAVMSPIVVRTSNQLAVTWLASKPKSDDANLQTIFDARSAMLRPRQIAVGKMTDGFGIVSDLQGGTLWILRSTQSDQTIDVYHGNDISLNRIASVQLPFDSPTPFAFRTSDSTFFVITTALGRSQAMASASTFVTEMTVRCK